MAFYRFRQNNSGGSFTNPARHIYVEADSEDEARDIFVTIPGCYFDPDYKRDCQCCGHRWEEYIWDEYANAYELMLAIESDLLTAEAWGITKEKVPFALIKSRTKDTLIP